MGINTYSIIIFSFFSILLIVSQKYFVPLRFNYTSFKTLYKFGINTSITSVLSSIYDNIYQVVLAKYFSQTQAGFYYQSKRLQDVPNNLINLLLQSVAFSGLSKVQQDSKKMNAAFFKISTYVSVIMGILIVVVVSYGDDILKLVYGSEWSEGYFFIQILSISSFFFLQEMLSRVFFKVINKTEKILHIDLLKKAYKRYLFF
ncbi:oligosaccharide flippase family protein [Tenacibaculum tangerinum]|uniref:Oligosaccharide flippase family protein n=1 Tax=Tenacibaculum tangerinum TaxID=3038772 RepID=A0ABY8L6U6_9FLAO|nr:oligosaccharide flippase family protein [Tenacibaculum tangerinum]WGH76984.1 oligosaccharide flippase family protein [Tenacibaculum tangerinum]